MNMYLKTCDWYCTSTLHTQIMLEHIKETATKLIRMKTTHVPWHSHHFYTICIHPNFTVFCPNVDPPKLPKAISNFYIHFFIIYYISDYTHTDRCIYASSTIHSPPPYSTTPIHKSLQVWLQMRINWRWTPALSWVGPSPTATDLSLHKCFLGKDISIQNSG